MQCLLAAPSERLATSKALEDGLTLLSAGLRVDSYVELLVMLAPILSFVRIAPCDAYQHFENQGDLLSSGRRYPPVGPPTQPKHSDNPHASRSVLSVQASRTTSV